MSGLYIGGASINQTPLNWKSNANNILEGIKLAKKNNLDVICFPELSITGYGCQDLFLSSWLIETAKNQLLSLLPHSKNIYVVVGLPYFLEGKVYNCAAMLHDGNILGITAKQNLARDGVHYEPRWFDPWPRLQKAEVSIGDRKVPFGDVTYDVKGFRVAFEICEDAWCENRPAHDFQQKGVDIILNPSASHFAMGKTLQREELVVSSTSTFNCAN